MKASLSEIFAAMKGITCAGVSLAKKGEDTKANPVAELGYESAALQYDTLCHIIERPERAEIATRKTLQFLEKALPILEQRPNLFLEFVNGSRGGQVKALVDHIQNILEREGDAQARSTVQIKNNRLAKVFQASYLPDGKVAAKPELSQTPQETPHERAARQGKCRAADRMQSKAAPEVVMA